MSKKTKKPRKTKTIFKKDAAVLAYIGQLDRLRWEYLRLSEQYGKDWNAHCKDCLKINSDIISNKFGNQSNVNENTVASPYFAKKYGIKIMADPKMTYEQVIGKLNKIELSETDFKDLSAFHRRLISPNDALHECLFSHFSPRAQSRLLEARYLDHKTKRFIVSVVNQLLLSNFIAISDDSISQEAATLMKHYEEVHMNNYRNMLLIDELCPEEIKSNIQTSQRYSDNFLFYSHLHEFALFEGVHPSAEIENSPFVTLTINVTLPVPKLVDVFNEFIALRRKEYFDSISDNKEVLRWVLPKNIHVPVLKKRLAVYRLYLGQLDEELFERVTKMDEKGCEYLESDNSPEAVVDFLFFEKYGQTYDKAESYVIEKYFGDKAKYDKRMNILKKKFKAISEKVDRYIKEAKTIIKNAENGFFPFWDKELLQ